MSSLGQVFFSIRTSVFRFRTSVFSLEPVFLVLGQVLLV